MEHEHCTHVAAQSLVCCKCGEKTWPCRHEPDHTLPGKRVEREDDGRLTILIPCRKCGEYY